MVSLLGEEEEEEVVEAIVIPCQGHFAWGKKE